MVGKLRTVRYVADDLGDRDFVIMARTDALSAIEAPGPRRGLELAVERALRYLDTGAPDLVWCDFPSPDREPTERFAAEVRRRFPEAQLGYNYSSSFKWHEEWDPITWSELGELGYRLILITHAAVHAAGLGFSQLLEAFSARDERGYLDLQRVEWMHAGLPTRDHHLFSGVPYHHLLGAELGAVRLSQEVAQVLHGRQAV